MSKLTDKQKRFCDEYLANGYNATQAAISAGYSENTSYSIGQENLTKPEIAKYLNERRDKVANKLEINQERIISELAKIAFGDIAHIYNEDGSLKPLHEIEESARGAIAGIDTYEEKSAFGEETITQGTVKKVKLWDKLKALDQLTRMLGYYEKDNKQQKGADVVVNNVTVTPEEAKTISKALEGDY